MFEMKLLLFLNLVFAASVVNAYVSEVTEILQLTQKVNQYVTDCIKEKEEEDGERKIETENNIARGGADDDDVAENVQDEEDKSVEKVTRCFFRKAGILDPDGNLNVDAASSILALIGVEKKEADEILEKCTTIAGYDAKDMAYAIFKCFEDGFKS